MICNVKTILKCEGDKVNGLRDLRSTFRPMLIRWKWLTIVVHVFVVLLDLVWLKTPAVSSSDWIARGSSVSSFVW